MKFKWDKNYIYRGIVAFCVIACSIIFYLLLNRWEQVTDLFSVIIGAISPIIVGIAVAYLLAPIMNILERSFYNKLAARVFKSESKASALSRILGIISVMLLMLIFIAGLILMVIPQLITSVEKLINNTDRYLAVAQEWIDGLLIENTDIVNTVDGLFKSAFGSVKNWLKDTFLSRIDVLIINISSGVFSVIKALFDFAVGIIISVYVLYSKESFCAQSKKLLYSIFKVKRVNSILGGFRFANKMLGGFLLGKLLSSLIVGIICAIFMLILGMPYVALISALIAVTNIIPFIGPFIGAVPSAFLLLLENPSHCLIFAIFIFVLQFFEGNVLSAKILGNNTGLTGFWVIFAILVGGMFGFVGMVIGVPLFAVLYHFISSVSKRKLSKRNLPVNTEDYKAIYEIEDDLN